MQLEILSDFTPQEDAFERAQTRGRGRRIAFAILVGRVDVPDHVFLDALRVLLGFDPESIERKPQGFSQLSESLEEIA